MDDKEYFAERERVERALAANAATEKARRIHLAIADRYALLAAGKGQLTDSDDGIANAPGPLG